MPGRLARFIPEWLIGAVCMVLPGMYNGFPLVNADSGAYIENAYKLYVPLDRPLGYSVFLRLGMMDLSLWLPVFIQSLLLAGLLIALTVHFLGSGYSRLKAVGVTLLLGCLSSAGWFAAQLSPDIFSAVLILATLCLACIPMARPWRWLLYAVVLLSILCHNSNLLISVGAGAVLLLVSLRARSLRRTGAELLLIGALGGLTLCTLTAIAGRGFRPSAGSHVFLVSRMVETGMMEQYLQDYCPTDTPRYRLCEWQGKLPARQWDFMWGEASPLQLAGGWLAVEPEYTRIIRNSLQRPKYLGLHLKYAVAGTVAQLPLLQAGDGLFSFGPGTSPYDRVDWYLHSQLPQFSASRQRRESLRLEAWNPVIIGAELLFMLLPVALIIFGKRQPGFGRPFAVAIILLLINAAMTATFATVIARYESRVIWILTFLSILYILRWLGSRSFRNRALH